jgi:PAS domain S-box-containing protein
VRLRTIIRAATITIGLVLLAGSALFIFTVAQVGALSAQAGVAERIERSAGNLSYLSDEFVEYGEKRQRLLWETEFAALEKTVTLLTPDTPEEKTRVEHIIENMRRARAVFDDVAARTAAGTGTGSPAAVTTFRHLAFSRLAVQNRMITADAVALARGLNRRVDGSITGTLGLLLGLLAAFTAFFLGVYVRVNRRMLDSLARLQRGAEIVGAGNLSHRIDHPRRDEFGDLTGAFNAMTANLRETTASKQELEEEVARRRQTEAALRTSEERFATTLASIGDAVIATDVRGMIGFMNEAAEKLTGIPAGRALGRPLSEVVVLADGPTGRPFADPVAAVLAGATPRPGDAHTVLIRADGTRVPVADSGAPILDRDGKISGVVLVMSDVTEQRRAEEVLQRDRETLERLVEEKSRDLLAARREAEESRRLSDLGTFAATIAHDLRNPLNVMSVALYNIERKAEQPKIEPHVRTIETKIRESEQIIDNLLHYSRKKPAARAEVDVHALVRESLEAVRSGSRKMISIILRPAALPGVRILADAVQLQEVFHNLISNACDAVSDGTGVVEIALENGRTEVSVSIRDNGPGIPPENLNRIFDPFFTTKPNGIGLGLAICRRIVALHNGELTFENGSGGGVTARLTLPKSASPLPPL